jgi:DNA-binding response OmpR family regulator
MTSIVGYVDLLIKGVVGALTEPQLNFLSKVKNNAERLTALVNDLLDISRIEQGRVELQLQPVAVETLVEQVMDLVHPKIEEKGQVLDAVMPAHLPKIKGDPDRMTQILTNLVSNAYKYTQLNGMITMYAYVRDGMMHVAVKDSGIGIAPENQKKIFERFYRVEDDPAVYEVSGTGLGLAITLSLIQMHGGDIWLESVLGEGSIFTFSVPLAEGEPTDDVGEMPEPLAVASPPTVLVVEDDQEIATLLKVTMEAEGMQVVTAFSGEDALRIARRDLPDFISLDIRLPDLDGLEVLQLLKREPETADIPVVIVSVVADRARGLALGALDYLNKPLDEQKLLGIIKNTLNKRGVVVVADSDKDVLNTMRTALQNKGIAVRTTTQGERALLLAQELQPSMMVLDLDLVDLSGYQLLDRLKHNKRTAVIPVVVTTSRDEVEVDAEQLQSFDNVRFVPKPFSVEALASDIYKIVNENGRGKES